MYQAEQIVDELVSQLQAALTGITDNYEIILVDDGSFDDSWNKIQANSEKESRVKGIKLSRNFGQSNAVTAGLSKANGECVFVLDCDLQDDPKHIQELYSKFKEGYEVVFTKRLKRKHGFFKSILAGIYYLLMKLVSRSEYTEQVGSFLLISSRVKNEFLKLKEQDKWYTSQIKWMGYRSATIQVEHSERHKGESSYSLYKSIKVSLPGLISYSNRLLYLSFVIGLVLICVSLIGFACYFYLLISGSSLPQMSLTNSLLLMCTGLILVFIGVLGLYIGRIHLQSKNRPLFLIDQEENFNNEG